MMRLWRGCQSKMPAEAKGLCAACKGDRKPASDGIREHGAVQRPGIYDADLDRQNKSRKWQEYTRPRILKRDPFCRMCDTAITEIIDHKIPAAVAVEQARASKRWPYDPWIGYYLESNLQGLCRGCHAKKTADDLRRIEPWPGILDEYDKQPKKVWSF